MPSLMEVEKQKVSFLIKNYKSADFPIKRMIFKVDINMDSIKSQRKWPDYAYNRQQICQLSLEDRQS